MTLDEGCAERGCPMHDSRETKGVVFIRKEWVNLTQEERFEIRQRKWWDWEDSFDIDGFMQAIEAKLKEKNA